MQSNRNTGEKKGLAKTKKGKVEWTYFIVNLGGLMVGY